MVVYLSLVLNIINGTDGFARIHLFYQLNTVLETLPGEDLQSLKRRSVR